MGRIVESFDPNERLLERILSKESMAVAWKRLKANHGAPGVDGIAIEQFPDYTRPFWTGIRESLLAGTYQPLPVRRVVIPKPTGGNGGTSPIFFHILSFGMSLCFLKKELERY